MYHVIDTNTEEEDIEEKDLSNKINSIKPAANPIMCVQYLTILLDYFNVNTLKVVSTFSDLESAIQEVYFSIVNNDKNDGPTSDVMDKQYVVLFYRDDSTMSKESTTTTLMDSVDGDLSTLLLKIGGGGGDHKLL